MQFWFIIWIEICEENKDGYENISSTYILKDKQIFKFGQFFTILDRIWMGYETFSTFFSLYLIHGRYLKI